MKKSAAVPIGICFAAMCCMLLFTHCRNKTSKTPETPAARPLYMNKLRLTAEQFDTLKTESASKLVFQFFYPGSGECQSPTLYVYSMKSMNQSTGKPPLQLQYDSVTSEPFTGRPQVLGDQQLLIASLDTLLNKVAKPYTGKNYYFLFTPKFQPSNPHIYYEISLEGPEGTIDGSSRTNPSPPANAF